jgi:hypothetical protein
MSALDELERTLARAVDAGAAAGRTEQASAPERQSEGRTGTKRPRARRGWHVFLTLLAAGSATTGALAATGNLPILQSGDRGANPNYMVLNIPGLDTKATAQPTLLPLRVKDPQGGPPWALRTFPIGRGHICAQAGQLYRGTFGVVTQSVDRVAAPSASGPAPAKTVFQELAPTAAMLGVRCGAARPGGQLITAHRLSTIINPDGTDLRCGNSPPQRGVAPCPITAVKVVRWGFLGPRARTAAFVAPGGRRGPTQQLDPATGGAYLFAESVDPTPFRESQRFERALRAKLLKRFPSLGSSATVRSSGALRQQVGEAAAYTRALAEQARPQRRANWRAQQAEAVDATFAGAAPRRVAGPGSKGGPLPGVAPVISSVPKVGRAKITATYRGRQRAIEVRFAAPVALDAHPGSYAVSIRGPQNGACGGRAQSAQADYAREMAAGEHLLIRVRPTHGNGRDRFPGWCDGGQYDVRVRYIVPNTNKPGPRSEQLVGRTSFEAR